uniref:Uncharacterized protein MANES_06G115400 n=1 Tax=Rhizophora mucronata TaxID=61149 RepID=A0A2P2PG19_RHIMU
MRLLCSFLGFHVESIQWQLGELDILSFSFNGFLVCLLTSFLEQGARKNGRRKEGRKPSDFLVLL